MSGASQMASAVTSPAGGSGSLTAARSGSGSTGCTSPPGTDQGVSSSSIKVAIFVLNIAGAVGNGTYGVASPAVQESTWQTAIDYFNNHGGFACRKLVPEFYQANPVDSSSLQSLCLDVQQTHPFFIFEGGAYGFVYPSLLSCYASAGIPWLSSTFATAQELKQCYPYSFFQG